MFSFDQNKKSLVVSGILAPRSWIQDPGCLLPKQNLSFVKGRGLCFVESRGLCCVNNKGLCFVNSRGLCSVSSTGLCCVNTKGLCCVNSKGLCCVNSKGLCFVNSKPLSGSSTVCTLKKGILGNVPVSEMGRHGSPQAPDG